MSFLNPHFDNNEDRVSHYAFLFFMGMLVLCLIMVIGMLFTL
jgi:hypothetical protein